MELYYGKRNYAVRNSRGSGLGSFHRLFDEDFDLFIA